MDELVLYTNKYEYFSDVSQPSLGVEHELTTNAMGEMDTETPAMRASMVSVHQRSPGGMHGQMETHWEENNSPACRYFNKHFTRSVHLHADASLSLSLFLFYTHTHTHTHTHTFETI